jgi:hypothetical protein
VIGMDDLPQGAFPDPPLTTIHIPLREIGGIARVGPHLIPAHASCPHRAPLLDDEIRAPHNDEIECVPSRAALAKLRR